MRKNNKVGLKKLPRLVVFDFDGVITNNKVILSQEGIEHVVCDRSDGLAFSMLSNSKIPCLILSKEKNPVVSVRAGKLKVPCIQGIDHKLKTLKVYCKKLKVNLKDVLYVGNDLNDVEVMLAVGQSASPADAHRYVRKISTIKLKRNGGDGAVRELVEDCLGCSYPGVRSK